MGALTLRLLARILFPSSMTTRPTRRAFLKSTTAGASLLFGAPALLSAKAPNETVRVAGIGVGGKGWTDINGAAKFGDVIAYCDIDTGKNRKGGYGAAAEKWPKAAGYTDFRKLIEKEHENLDAVTISTPDHMHAAITMTAMEHGLAVYTQKPLTRTVHEARALTLAAKKHGVSTQMGNQGHSGPGYRTLVKIVQSGTIGKIKAAHAWSNRPIWPQGIDRPAGSDPVPKSVDWDLWLGVAPERPYKRDAYHPFKWRGWFDFGAGALGDMGCHIIDPVVWALELGPPNSVSYSGPKPNTETFPKTEVLTYRFPGTKHTAGDELTMQWHDGGKRPSSEGTHLPGDGAIPSQGSMFIGTEGTLVCAHHAMPKLYPDEKFAGTELPRADGVDHYGNWIDGIRTGKAPGSNFAYAGPMTETVLLGVIASRVGEGKLLWDAEKLRFTDSEAASAFVQQEYRKGWEVEGL